MKKEEAIKAIKDNYPPSRYSMLREALDMSIEALEKAEKYKWHDLRKNPDDLPDDEREYWVHGVWEPGKVIEGGCVFKKDYGCFETFWNFNVTAWKEIEPFEVEE